MGGLLGGTQCVHGLIPPTVLVVVFHVVSTKTTRQGGEPVLDFCTKSDDPSDWNRPMRLEYICNTTYNLRGKRRHVCFVGINMPHLGVNMPHLITPGSPKVTMLRQKERPALVNEYLPGHAGVGCGRSTPYLFDVYIIGPILGKNISILSLILPDNMLRFLGENSESFRYYS